MVEPEEECSAGERRGQHDEARYAHRADYFARGA